VRAGNRRTAQAGRRPCQTFRCFASWSRTDATGNTVYAATDFGVFMSTDAGATWSAFDLGTLAVVPVFDIEQISAE
jgi:hypothetical protein